MMFVFNKLIFFLTFSFIDNHIYLYHTYDGFDLEFYDCVLFQSFYYCRRPTSPINLTRAHQTESCHLNGGQLHRFSELKDKHINTSTILHEWRSSIERVEQYSRYLTHPTPDKDGHICQCIDSASFGRNCEYQLPVGDTFQDTLQWRLITRQENLNQVQIHGDIVCYTTLTCNSTILCLDWREICDGIQNCENATDEENCDLLELNVCDDDDQYRCMNGMCIPQEYFLDGEFDCLDWSDEIQYKKSEECARESVSMRCDDHICPPNEWPCGDGQCIRDRLAFQTTKDYATCENRRNQYFNCENNLFRWSWTMPNGRCYEDTLYETSVLTNRTQEEYCKYLLRCVLSYGREKQCPCPNGPSCKNEIRQRCLYQWIQYPQKFFITSFIYHFYVFTPTIEGYSLHYRYEINGIVRCQRSFILIIKPDLISPLENPARTVHDYVCRKAFSNSSEEIPIPAHDCHHQNESTNICDEWNPCMSITRLRDGFINCLNQQDEGENNNKSDVAKSCSRLQRHRFRCSTKQSTCLSVMVLGNGQFDCHNGFDESWFGSGRPLSTMHCDDQRKDQCSHLRRYIEQSWHKTSDLEQLFLTNRIIPFRSYCDTFWNLDPPEDENRTECRQGWVCASDQLQCHTKQCFDRSWKMDFKWDCPEARDEAGLLHAIANSAPPTTQSANASDSPPYFAIGNCNQIPQFLCLSPFTSFLQFHCIHQDRIGDGRIDCAGAIDEQNILKHCSQSQPLGFHYLCLSTNTCIPYFHHCKPGYRCPNKADDKLWCSFLDRSTNCPNVNSFRCLDGTCWRNGRCDERFHCDYSEDEYMCDYPSTAKQKLIPFRSEKQLHMNNKRKSFQLPHSLHDALTSESTTTNNASTQFTSTSAPSLPHPSSSSVNLTAYRCNRGIGVLSPDNQTVCFCPPQYYGDRCQYHNDRLSVLLHLNLSQSIYKTATDPNIILKLLLIFFDHNQTLMTHEFHLRPALKDTIDEKKRVYFFYSHASNTRQRRKDRYHNRSDILHHHPNSIRIDLYELRPHERPFLVSVWKYPLFFDYLPVSHFAKVLHLRRLNATENPCSNDPCPPNAACYPLTNDDSQHVCVCKENYSGKDCLTEDEECRDGHCAEGSLCQSSYRAAHRGNHHAYCVCPFGRFGDQCDVEFDSCNPNPCQNGGSCLFSSNPDQTTCVCTIEYYGDKCQLRKRHIRLSVDTSVQHAGVVIQYFDIDFVSLDLYFVHQQVYTFIPRRIEYYYIQPHAPNIVLAKLYSSHEDVTPQSYLLSLSTNITSIEAKTVISDFSQCQHVHQRFKDLSPIRYHSLCRNDTTLLCFRNDHYLCICVDNHTRVECLIYDQQLDRCSECLHNGRCLQGDPTRSNDFVCLCPLCYSGGQCQFSSKSFTFTLDQLFYTDLVLSHRSRIVVILLIFFSILAFILAIPNNLFSFVTFHQEACLRNGVGHYLLTLSVISQLNLALLVARLTHLSLNIVGQSSSSSINTILCKVWNYFLVSSSRMVYWFSSLIAIERVYMSVVLNGQWLKQPRIARRFILIIIFTTLLSTVYECVFFRSLSISDIKQRSMCIFEFPHAHRSQWMIVHLLVSTLHSVVPFIINLCSTITIGIMVVKKKMNTRRTDKRRTMTCIGRIRFILNVLNENRELVIGPGLTLIPQLFSLPLFISSFTLNCQNIENSWIRYLLIVSYLTSFTPQIISFVLYISPSSFYSDEWHKTKLQKRVHSILRWRQLEREKR